jgi:hypothetical protein
MRCVGFEIRLRGLCELGLRQCWTRYEGRLAVEDLSALLQSRECRVADVKITKTKLDLHRPRLAWPGWAGACAGRRGNQSQPPKEETGTNNSVIDRLVLCMIKRLTLRKMDVLVIGNRGEGRSTQGACTLS